MRQFNLLSLMVAAAMVVIGGLLHLAGCVKLSQGGRQGSAGMPVRR